MCVYVRCELVSNRQLGKRHMVRLGTTPMTNRVVWMIRRSLSDNHEISNDFLLETWNWNMAVGVGVGHFKVDCADRSMAKRKSRWAIYCAARIAEIWKLALPNRRWGRVVLATVNHILDLTNKEILIFAHRRVCLMLMCFLRPISLWQNISGWTTNNNITYNRIGRVIPNTLADRCCEHLLKNFPYFSSSSRPSCSDSLSDLNRSLDAKCLSMRASLPSIAFIRPPIEIEMPSNSMRFT